MFTRHPHADTIRGQESGQATTATSAAATMQEVHLEISFRVKTGFWKACSDHGTDESSRA